MQSPPPPERSPAVTALPLAAVEVPRALPAPLWRKIFIARDGKVRSVWAIAAFLAVLGLFGAAQAWVLGALSLLPGTLEELPISDPRIGLFQLVRVANVLVASAVGAAIVRGRLRDVGFAHPHPGRQFGLGALAGVALLTTSVTIAVLSGHERTSGPDLSLHVLATGVWLLLVFAAVGFAEETAMRGFLLQQLRRGLGRFGPRTGAFAAVFITGALFGLGHLDNPNATWIGVANIALGGWVLGALVIRTGSLWLPIGLHTGWNLTQGYVWGEPVSGLTTGASLMHRAWFDRSIWTGGDFGPEASIEMAVLLAIALAALALWRPRARPVPAPAPLASEN